MRWPLDRPCTSQWSIPCRSLPNEAEKKPGLHAVHALEPLFGANVPLGQDTHCSARVAPGYPLAVPFGHS
jgi:hypothetical protein